MYSQTYTKQAFLESIKSLTLKGGDLLKEVLNNSNSEISCGKDLNKLKTFGFEGSEIECKRQVTW